MLTMFQTSKGSTYVVNPDGTTKRFKVPHTGHSASDVGWKDSSDLTVYISEKAVYHLLDSLNDGRVMVIRPDGIRTVYRNGDVWSWDAVLYTYVTAPEVGRSPVEYWGLVDKSHGQICTEYHIGNLITEVK